MKNYVFKLERDLESPIDYIFKYSRDRSEFNKIQSDAYLKIAEFKKELIESLYEYEDLVFNVFINDSGSDKETKDLMIQILISVCAEKDIGLKFIVKDGDSYVSNTILGN